MSVPSCVCPSPYMRWKLTLFTGECSGYTETCLITTAEVLKLPFVRLDQPFLVTSGIRSLRFFISANHIAPCHIIHWRIYTGLLISAGYRNDTRSHPLRPILLTISNFCIVFLWSLAQLQCGCVYSTEVIFFFLTPWDISDREITTKWLKQNLRHHLI